MKKQKDTDLLQDDPSLSRLTILNRKNQSVILYNLSENDKLTVTERETLNRLIQFHVIKPRVTIIGIGEYSNAIITRYSQIDTIIFETIVIDTDRTRLDFLKADKRLLIGTSICDGIDPGKNSSLAEESLRKAKGTLHDLLVSDDLVIIIAAVEDAVGFGSAPILAKFLREWGIPVLGMIISPPSDDNLIHCEPEQKNLFYRSFDTTINIDAKKVSSCFDLSEEAIHSFIQQIITEFLKNLAGGLLDSDDVYIKHHIDLSSLCSLLKSGGSGGLTFAEDIPEKVAEKCFRYWLSDEDVTRISGGLLTIIAGETFSKDDAEHLVRSFSDSIGHELNLVYSLHYEKKYETEVRVVAAFNGIRNLSSLSTSRE